MKNHPQEALTQLDPAYKLGQGLEDCEKGYCVVEGIVEQRLCENFVFDDIFPTGVTKFKQGRGTFMSPRRFVVCSDL